MVSGVVAVVTKAVQEASTKTKFTNKKTFLKLQLLGEYKFLDKDGRKILPLGEFTKDFDEALKTKNLQDSTYIWQELVLSKATKL